MNKNLEQILHQVAVKKLIARNCPLNQEARQDVDSSKNNDQDLDLFNSENHDQVCGQNEVNDTKIRFPVQGIFVRQNNCQ